MIIQQIPKCLNFLKLKLTNIRVDIYLLKVSNRKTRTICIICLILTIDTRNDVIGVALLSLLLTLNSIYKLFAFKCQPHKTVKSTQTIRRQLADVLFECV